MKVIDLFCGCGGFSLGFAQEGFDVVLGVDNWQVSCDSFKANFPKADVWCRDVKDIATKELPSVDVIVGSPPCQTFSISRKLNNPENEKPEPSLLYKFLQLIAEKQPKFWVLEEVPSVRHFLPRNVSYSLLCANSFGLKHKRRRVFAGVFPRVLVSGVCEIVHPTPVASEWKGITKRGARFGDFLGRRPTTAEMLSAMGFPDNYVVLGSKKEQVIQVGNAVCPPIARAIAGEIKKELLR